MSDQKPSIHAWLSSAQGYIAFFSALVGVFAAVQSLSSKRDADLSAQEAATYKRQLEAQAHFRAERESRVRLDGVAYEAVVKVIEVGTSNVPPIVMEKRERAAMALVLSTASDEMKAALLEVLKTSPNVTAAVQQSAGKTAEALRDAAPRDFQVVAPAPAGLVAAASPGQLAGYRVVFFYCESSSSPGTTKSQEAMARALQAELGRDENLKHMKFEVKELPEVLNASPGYSIHTNQIRYNPEDKEEASSLALKALLEKTGVATAGRLDFSRVTVGKRTPSYLSVFLCGQRGAA